jgi:hypothetical protein
MSYAKPTKKRAGAVPGAAEPSTNIVEKLPQMRRKALHLVRQAVSAGRRAYMLVKNLVEGNAPLTVQGQGWRGARQCMKLW